MPLSFFYYLSVSSRRIQHKASPERTASKLILSREKPSYFWVKLPFHEPVTFKFLIDALRVITSAIKMFEFPIIQFAEIRLSVIAILKLYNCRSNNYAYPQLHSKVSHKGQRVALVQFSFEYHLFYPVPDLLLMIISMYVLLIEKQTHIVRNVLSVFILYILYAHYIRQISDCQQHIFFRCIFGEY